MTEPEYDWAIRFPGSDVNHIQQSEADARAIVARYPDHDVKLLRRSARVYTPNWEEVEDE